MSNRPGARIAWILVPLLFILIACSVSRDDTPTAPSGYIDEQRAVEQAKLYCEQAHSSPQETPHDIQSHLLTCHEVKGQTVPTVCDQLPSDLMVWIVSMDGLWLHSGPIGEDGNAMLISFHHCRVLMDAKTAELLELTN